MATTVAGLHTLYMCVCVYSVCVCTCCQKQLDRSVPSIPVCLLVFLISVFFFFTNFGALKQKNMKMPHFFPVRKDVDFLLFLRRERGAMSFVVNEETWAHSKKKRKEILLIKVSVSWHEEMYLLSHHANTEWLQAKVSLNLCSKKIWMLEKKGEDITYLMSFFLLKHSWAKGG